MKAILKLSRKLYKLAYNDLSENTSPRQSLLRFLEAISDEDTELMVNMLELYGEARVHKWCTNIRTRVENTPRTFTSIKINLGM